MSFTVSFRVVPRAAERYANAIQVRTYGKILDFSCGDEFVLELVSGADFRCVLHHISSLTHLKKSWGQVWLESGPKPTKTKI